MASWDNETGAVTSHAVAAEDVAASFTQVKLSSGLLPKDAIFWKQQAQTMTLGIYVPARRWRVHLSLGGEAQQLQLPMPPHLFVGHGQSYSIYAVKKRPTNPFDPLFHLPAPNVGSSGSICQGNTPFPTCSADTIHKALKLFWEQSLFNSHLAGKKSVSHSGDVRQLWQELAERKRFPLRELVSMNKRIQSLL